ncbi:IS66 family insertion sequence element accessory protein TnpB [Chitinophaga ginsengisoli]|uniref:IS66 family insertion sequence element accessory protein TnpB n=1 Tax=Chitinophaga ginsengisoli TaxID=363837 RepID=UPI003742184C
MLTLIRNDALNPDCRYFLYRVPFNINKSFYSLAAIVKEQMQMDPLSKDVSIFLNNRCIQIKVLVWQGDKFAIFRKTGGRYFRTARFLHDQRHSNCL